MDKIQTLKSQMTARTNKIMTLQESKAKAYDLLVVIQNAQTELNKVNQEIVNLSVEEKKPIEE
jgi:hypothetical protein